MAARREQAMQVEIAQLAGKDGGKDENLASALRAVDSCAPGTQLLVLPELHLSGFPSRRSVASLAEPLNGTGVSAMCAAARRRGVSVAFGFAEVDGDRYYNTTVLATPADGVVLVYRKTHLFAGDIGVFTPGDRMVTTVWNGIRVGLLICYDIEFPETARALAQLGAQLFIVTNGNMDPYGPVHRNCILARATENQAYALMANRVGTGDNELVFAGGSAVVDPFGVVLCEAGREETTIRTTLALSRLDAVRRHYVYLEDQRLRLPGEVGEEGNRRYLTIPPAAGA
jgi:(R)-amidase